MLYVLLIFNTLCFYKMQDQSGGTSNCISSNMGVLSARRTQQSDEQAIKVLVFQGLLGFSVEYITARHFL